MVVGSASWPLKQWPKDKIGGREDNQGRYGFDRNRERVKLRPSLWNKYSSPGSKEVFSDKKKGCEELHAQSKCISWEVTSSEERIKNA